MFGGCHSNVFFVFTGDIVHDGFHHLVNRFGKTLASTVVCAQPEHACALFGVTRWHVRRNTELHFGATIRSRSRVVIHAGVRVLVFEVLCDTNHACCQGHTGVSAKLVVPSDNGLLWCRRVHVVLMAVMWW